MSDDPTQPRLVDPRSAGARPPYPPPPEPGSSDADDLRPPADYGIDRARPPAGRLAGMSALITGGDSGIGRAVAIAFAREGADLVIGYHDEIDDAAETVRLVEGIGGRAVAVGGDVGQEGDCHALVERTVTEYGRLDILVNNAATQVSLTSVEEVTTETWRRIMATNLDGPFYLIRAALPHLQPGASIINTSSVQAYTPSFELFPYAATKGALITLTKALAKGLAGKGIRVNAVCPGPVWTPLVASTSKPEDLQSFGQASPLGRPAQPAELAGIYVFLASDEATYVTGGSFGVHGGSDLP